MRISLKDAMANPAMAAALRKQTSLDIRKAEVASLPNPSPILISPKGGGVKGVPNPSPRPFPLPRSWSRAVPTTLDGIRFPSKMEARVYQTLKTSMEEGDILYRQVRFPLLSSAPTETGVPLAFTVDFVIVRGKGWRVVDAKGKRKSREWERGKRAFEACYGVPVEEVDK